MCTMHMDPIISVLIGPTSTILYFLSAHPREKLFWVHLFPVAITIIDESLESLLNAVIIPVGSQETWFSSSFRALKNVPTGLKYPKC